MERYGDMNPLMKAKRRLEVLEMKNILMMGNILGRDWRATALRKIRDLKSGIVVIK